MSDEDWSRSWVVFRSDVCRTGWKGVWDSLIAALRGSTMPRTVNKAFTCSIYAKPETSIDVWGAQVENQGSERV